MDATAFTPSRVKSKWLEILGLGTIAVLGFAAVWAVCHPGFMSPDSVNQLRQARKVWFGDDHPPLMAMIWWVTDQVVPGPLGMLLVMNALYWGALFSIFRDYPLSRRARLIAFAFVAFFPPLFVNLGVIWKDILMHGALLGVLAAYLRHLRTHSRLSLALALVFSVLAIGSRHNAAAAVWPLLALIVAQQRPLARLGGKLRKVAILAGSFALVVVMQQGLSRVMRPFVHETHYWQTVPLYDLAGMSLYENKVLFDRRDGVFRKTAKVKDIRAVFNPYHSLSLYGCRTKGCVPLLKMTDDPEKQANILRRWREALFAHPTSYLRTRRKVYRRLAGIGGPPFVTWPRIERNPWGYQLEPSPLRDAVMNGLEALRATPIYKAWIYMVATAFAMGAAGAAHRHGQSALPLALGASGLLYHFTFFVFAQSDDYRYSIWTIACSVFTVLALPAALPEHWKSRVRGVFGVARFGPTRRSAVASSGR